MRQSWLKQMRSNLMDEKPWSSVKEHVRTEWINDRCDGEWDDVVIRQGQKEWTVEKGSLLLLAALMGQSDWVKGLIESGADVNLQDQKGRTALMMAFFSGRKNALNMMKALIQAGARVDIKDGRGCSVLGYVSLKGDEIVGRYLLEHQASVHDVDDEGTSILMKAVDSENLSWLKTVIEYQPDLNREEVNEASHLRGSWKTALIKAIDLNHVEMVKLLLEAGADSNKLLKIDRTPLMHAAEVGASDQILQELIDKGAVVDAINAGRKETALMLAGCVGQSQTFKFLIRKGASVMMKDKKGQNALMMACYQINEEMIKQALSAGAVLNDQDSSGRSALMIACANGSKECVNVLLQAGADVTLKNKSGETALFYLLRNRWLWGMHSDEALTVMRNLVKAGCSLNEVSKEGTVLMAALKINEEKAIKECLNACVNVNGKDLDGETALILAARNGSVDQIKMLLEAGADPKIVNSNEDNVLMVACDELVEGVEEIKLVDVNRVNLQGETLLIKAIQNNVRPVFEACLKENVDLEHKDRQGLTALMWALKLKDPPMVKALIQRGVSLTRKGCQGSPVESPEESPEAFLHWIVDHSSTELVKVWMEAFIQKESLEKAARACVELDHFWKGSLAKRDPELIRYINDFVDFDRLKSCQQSVEQEQESTGSRPVSRL